MSGSRVSTTTMELVHNQVALIIADLDLHSYYQLLEVGPEDSAGVVKFNYDTLSHEYGKLRSHDRCTDELRAGLDLLLDRLEEAHQVLCNSRLREEYDDRLALGETRHALAVKVRAEDRAAGRPAGVSLDARVKELGAAETPLPDQFDDQTAQGPTVPPHHDPPPPVPEPALDLDPAADEELTGNTTRRFAYGSRAPAAPSPVAVPSGPDPGGEEETTRRDQRSALPLAEPAPQKESSEEYVADDATEQDVQVPVQAEQTERMVAPTLDKPE